MLDSLTKDWFPAQWQYIFLDLMLKTSWRSYPWSFNSGSLFSTKKLLDYFTLILISFPLGGCVDVAVDSRANHQRYRYDANSLQSHASTIIQFENDEWVC